MIAIYIYLSIVVGSMIVTADQQLKLVHVLLAQADQYSIPAYLATTDMAEDRPDKRFTVKTPTVGDMTNEEKRLTFNLGVRLRERYDSFLGDVYAAEISRTRTTDSDVSKMSGALVNAGLWPPSPMQQWSTDLLWQPIPAEYEPRLIDKLLMGRLCPEFRKETKKVRKRPETLSREAKWKALFKYISGVSGLRVNNSEEVTFVFKSLRSRATHDQPVPLWAKVLPEDTMMEVVYFEDTILSKTNIQNQLNGGFLVEKILHDSVGYVQGSLPDERKIMIYAGDSELLMGVMKVIGTWYPHLPNVASALIFELYRDTYSQGYGMKVFYNVGENDLMIPLDIPGCNKLQNSTGCELEGLVGLLLSILPGNDSLLCIHPVNMVTIEQGLYVRIAENGASKSSYGIFVVFSLWALVIYL